MWWIVSAIIFFVILGCTSSSHCAVCGNDFKKVKYKWQHDGKDHYVCPHCNQRLERERSRLAFGDSPRQSVQFNDQKSVGGGTLVALGIMLLVTFSLAISSTGTESKKTPEPVTVPVPDPPGLEMPNSEIEMTD